MKTRAYLLISGVIFGLVAALHLIRLVNQWTFEMGPWSIPMWMSWLGTIVPAALCGWAFHLLSSLGRRP
jgi:hypothetical protein